MLALLVPYYHYGITGTLVSLKYLVMAPHTLVSLDCHMSISCWLHVFPSVIRLSLDGSSGYLVSLKYLVFAPHVHKVHLGRASGSVVSYPYLLVAPLLP